MTPRGGRVGTLLQAIGLALIVLVAPAASEAQPAGRVARIGYLLLPPLAEKPSTERQAFLDGLRELGYEEGRNLVVVYRSAAWNVELLPDLAAELVELKVDVILTAGPQATQAAREATKVTPIVMVAGIDPVASGLVGSLARPDANLTGFATKLPGLAGKGLELLREAVPPGTRVVVIWNPGNPGAAADWKDVQAAARTLGVALESLEVRRDPDRRLPGDPRGLRPEEPRSRGHGAAGLRRGRRTHELRAEVVGPLPPGRGSRGQDPQGDAAGPAAHRATDDVRAGDQSAHGEGSEPDPAALAAPAGRSRDRVDVAAAATGPGG
jgi:hypothetical protein